MTLRRYGWAALVGLSAMTGQTAQAAEPARLGLPAATPIPTVQPDGVQKLADVIAAHLEQAGTLKQYRVDIAVRSGAVELTGVVTDQPQRDEVLRLVQGVPGVARVIDRMTVDNPVVRVRLQDREATKADKPADADEASAPLPPPIFSGKPGPNAAANDKAANNEKAANDKPASNDDKSKGMIPAPQPIFSCNPGYNALNPPSFPPYAWPTYAPHNNFSRVAYPTAYPNNAWPFIGPLYPYPKVPLGWRSVKLEWDDGYWWFSRVGNKHDWWKLRYW